MGWAPGAIRFRPMVGDRARPVDRRWTVLAGLRRFGLGAGGALLPVQSCVFVAPEDPAATLFAGPSGADLICMQFPKRARD